MFQGWKEYTITGKIPHAVGYSRAFCYSQLQCQSLLNKQAGHQPTQSQLRQKLYEVICYPQRLRELRRHCYCDVNSQDEILTDINIKERACNTAKTASNNVIQTDLAEKLEKELKQSVAHLSNIAG